MAYEKKIPVDLDCPLRLTMSLIESKWKSCILDELRSGSPMRPSEIHKCLSEAVPRVLDIQLKEMVEDGLVTLTLCSNGVKSTLRYLNGNMADKKSTLKINNITT